MFSDRMNFFRQRYKLKGLTESEFIKAYIGDYDREVTLNHNSLKEQQQKYI